MPNREIGQTCLGLRAYVPICIAAPGYTYTGQPSPGAVVDAATKPVPIYPLVVSSCLKLAYIAPGKGPFVTDLLTQNGISAAQYLAWNVDAHDAQGNPVVWAGYWVCVKA